MSPSVRIMSSSSRFQGLNPAPPKAALMAGTRQKAGHAARRRRPNAQRVGGGGDRRCAGAWGKSAELSPHNDFSLAATKNRCRVVTVRMVLTFQPGRRFIE